jgi:tRNA modification GTPase
VSARDGLGSHQSAELVSIDLNEAMAALLEITGEKLGADLLDRVFERFCIGK